MNQVPSETPAIHNQRPVAFRGLRHHSQSPTPWRSATLAHPAEKMMFSDVDHPAAVEYSRFQFAHGNAIAMIVISAERAAKDTSSHVLLAVRAAATVISLAVRSSARIRVSPDGKAAEISYGHPMTTTTFPTRRLQLEGLRPVDVRRVLVAAVIVAIVMLSTIAARSVSGPGASRPVSPTDGPPSSAQVLAAQG